MLSFDLINSLVSFVKESFGSEKNVGFSFTTNGLLLTEEKFQFFVENNFNITVSIDGPKSVHDKNRCYANGIGTFDRVEKNLRSFYDFNHDFYSKNIEFNCTIDSYSDISEINAFFESNPMIFGGKVRFAPVSSKADVINNSVYNKLLLDFELAKSSNDFSFLRQPVVNGFIGNLIDKIKYRKQGVFAVEGKKVCVPFLDRTYVRVNGSLQFCERCFAYNFCEMCLVSFIENDEFNAELARKKCSGYRDILKLAILIYIELEVRGLQGDY